MSLQIISPPCGSAEITLNRRFTLLIHEGLNLGFCLTVRGFARSEVATDAEGQHRCCPEEVLISSSKIPQINIEFILQLNALVLTYKFPFAWIRNPSGKEIIHTPLKKNTFSPESRDRTQKLLLDIF